MWITLRQYLICLDCEAKSDVIDQIDLMAIRMAIKTTTAPGVRTENCDLCAPLVGVEDGPTAVESSKHFLGWKTELPPHPAVPLLDIYAKELKAFKEADAQFAHLCS